MTWTDGTFKKMKMAPTCLLCVFVGLALFFRTLTTTACAQFFPYMPRLKDCFGIVFLNAAELSFLHSVFPVVLTAVTTSLVFLYCDPSQNSSHFCLNCLSDGEDWIVFLLSTLWSESRQPNIQALGEFVRSFYVLVLTNGHQQVASVWSAGKSIWGLFVLTNRHGKVYWTLLTPLSVSA